MGQRHQLFVIAKIQGRYRSLAAVHHQWLYGLSALKSCDRLIKIFSDPGNRHVLRLELARASTLPAEVWKKKLEWNNCIPEFPFVTTCLTIGAGVDSDTGDTSLVIPERWNMGFDEGDNNDGITVLDITNPEGVRYCFVQWLCGGRDSMVPLTGEDYLTTYYEPADHTAEMKGVMQRLEKLPLIGSGDLQDAWPDGSWKTREQNGLSPVDSDPCASDTSPQTSAAGTGSLTRLAMERTIETLLTEEDDLLEEVEQLPLFLPSLRSYLSRHPGVVSSSPFGFDMLTRALQGLHELDLHLYPDLSGEQVLALVANAASEITMLDLSGNHNLSPEHISRLHHHNKILKLCVWDNDGIPLADLKALVAQGTVRELLHRDLFLQPFHEYEKRASRRAKAHEVTNKTVSDFPGSCASQLIWAWAKGAQHEDASCETNPFSPESRLYKEIQSMTPGMQLGDPFEPLPLMVLPIGDAPLTPESLLTVTGRLIKALPLLNPSPFSRSTTGLFFASAMALSDSTSPYTVHPLPPKLYANARAAYQSTGVHLGDSTISVAPGKWSVLFIQVLKQGFSTVGMRTAFLSANDKGELRVCDSATFMAETGSTHLSSNWKDVSDSVNVTDCDEETAKDFIRLVDLVNGKASTN